MTLTITNDESAPTVTLSSNASTIAENAGGSSLTLTATSSIATYEDITVSVSTSGTATEGTDYRMVQYQILLFLQEQLLELQTLHQLMILCMKMMKLAIIDIAVSGGGASESGGTQQLTLTITRMIKL